MASRCAGVGMSDGNIRLTYVCRLKSDPFFLRRAIAVMLTALFLFSKP
jgi:hypothetical protein